MPTTFIETPRFPEDLGAWAEGGAGYSTTIIVLSSGYESRNANWLLGRARWDVSNGLRKQADVAACIAFFRAMKGRTYGFRFKDWNDYSATVAEGALDATASSTVFQLVKVYAAGALSERRYIQKPVATGFAMYNLGVLMTSGYSLDPTTGLVTISAPGTITNYTWSGEFDVPCRFDTDEMHGTREPQGGFYQWSSIPIVEIRL